ncbi:MAG: CDP-diacylglycerol--serine O-phosphatidyltransferase [Chthoniobacterales bacterium]|nr:CDP-diacylglycerol--serine O-phosphatidyltransferase [Chthoniobacterales bacterium]
MNKTSGDPKIYLLPNLMTAGNLFCGFAAIFKIIEAGRLSFDLGLAAPLYYQAIGFILGACVFDLLDGRLARLGGHESPFGREFDSLADVISFGLAPALLVYQIVLVDFPRLGWPIAFVYLLCGALRLARFNCLSADGVGDSQGDFRGFPIPAAAGLIGSLTLFLLWLAEGERNLGMWKFILPPLMLFLSFMMFSNVRYPSFKSLGWKTQRSLPKFLLIIMVIVVAVMNYEWMPAIIFILFLIYGFVRPYLSRAWRRELEAEVEGVENTEGGDVGRIGSGRGSERISDREE